jgi:hypothetical protein
VHRAQAAKEHHHAEAFSGCDNSGDVDVRRRNLRERAEHVNLVNLTNHDHGDVQGRHVVHCEIATPSVHGTWRRPGSFDLKQLYRSRLGPNWHRGKHLAHRGHRSSVNRRQATGVFINCIKCINGFSRGGRPSRAGLGEHGEQGVSLPGRPVFWENQDGHIHDRGCGKSRGQSRLKWESLQLG